MNKLVAYLFFLVFFITSCTDSSIGEEPSGRGDTDVKQVTLVYAVNRNSLWDDLTLNTRQMCEGLRNLPEGEYVILLFRTDKEGTEESAGLYKAVSGPKPEFTLIKKYSRDLLSTDPERMKDVIEESLKEKGKIYNLFFWGHGMAWTPYFSDHNRTRGGLPNGNVDALDIPEMFSFGGDNNKDWTDIDELEKAVPDNIFETIWFDCCYMSNIETIYQLRNKCKKMVAYPTEIAGTGLPYHLVLPHLLNDPQDLVGASDALYNFYAPKTPVTVAVMDMTKIEAVAESCRKIYKSGDNRPKSYGLQNYSRSYPNPYYDFGQFVREYAQANDVEELLPEFNEALNSFVICKMASDRNFDGQIIVKENYSGISTHLYENKNSAKENYYRELDWFKATYGSSEN
ncbi:MAG: hypothetical protein K2H18_00995 [Muribaculaceae bacterium]|nr:hypothetical protein [Muribaculaceae bacterium]